MADLQVLDGGAAGAAPAGGADGPVPRGAGGARGAVVRHLRPVRSFERAAGARPACPPVSLPPVRRSGDGVGVAPGPAGRVVPAPFPLDPVPRAAAVRAAIRPAAPTRFRPAGPDDRRPAGPVSRRPAGSVDRRPAGSVDQCPAGPVDRRPAGSVDQCPAGAVGRRPAGPRVLARPVRIPPPHVALQRRRVAAAVAVAALTMLAVLLLGVLADVAAAVREPGPVTERSLTAVVPVAEEGSARGLR